MEKSTKYLLQRKCSSYVYSTWISLPLYITQSTHTCDNLIPDLNHKGPVTEHPINMYGAFPQNNLYLLTCGQFTKKHVIPKITLTARTVLLMGETYNLSSNSIHNVITKNDSVYLSIYDTLKKASSQVSQPGLQQDVMIQQLCAA